MVNKYRELYAYGINALSKKINAGWEPNRATNSFMSDDITEIKVYTPDNFSLIFFNDPSAYLYVESWESLNVLDHYAVLLYLAKHHYAAIKKLAE